MHTYAPVHLSRARGTSADRSRSSGQRCNDLVYDAVDQGSHLVVSPVLNRMRHVDTCDIREAERRGLGISP